jgi:hypothetical protein
MKDWIIDILDLIGAVFVIVLIYEIAHFFS